MIQILSSLILLGCLLLPSTLTTLCHHHGGHREEIIGFCHAEPGEGYRHHEERTQLTRVHCVTHRKAFQDRMTSPSPESPREFPSVRTPAPTTMPPGRPCEQQAFQNGREPPAMPQLLLSTVLLI